MNPMQLIHLINNGQNPQELAMSLLKQEMGNTPMGQNLLQMIDEGNINDLEKFARNVVQQRGMDFDKEFASFRKMLGLNK